MREMDTPELLDTLLPPVVNIPGRASDVPRLQALIEAVNANPFEVRVLHLFGPSTTGIAQRVRSGRAVCVELARAILFDRARRAGRPVPPPWLTQLDALDEALTHLAAGEFPELARPESGPKHPFEGVSKLVFKSSSGFISFDFGIKTSKSAF